MKSKKFEGIAVLPKTAAKIRAVARKEKTPIYRVVERLAAAK